MGDRTREKTKRGNGLIGGRGESVVDYLIVNQEGWNKIKKFKIRKRTESDHQS